MARTDAPSEARTHLEQLGGALHRHGWMAEVTEVNGLALYVINPGAPVMRERIICHQSEGGVLEYAWWWGRRIASVEQRDDAARVIMNVLTPMGPGGRS